MTRVNLYGPLTSLQNVPRAVRDTLANRYDDYIADIERSAGLPVPTYVRPQTYLLVNLLTTLPGLDISPAVIIVTRGTNSRPVINGKSLDLPLDIGIALFTTSFEGDGAREAAGVYAAATAGILLHWRTLGGAMDGSLRVQSWDDLRMDDLPEEDQRTRAIVRLEFTVMVKDVVREGLAPPRPLDPTNDPGPNSTVQTTQVTIRKEDS